MRASRVHESGAPSVLTLDEGVPVPAVADGQVLVRNTFSGLNFIDCYHRSGLYKREHPFIGGTEGAGVIVQTTPKAEELGLSVDTRVAYYALGSYAEYTAAPAAKVVAIPDDVSFDVATGATLQGMTAHYLLRSVYPLAEGEWCVIHAGAGGVGQLAVQMAKILGAHVITTTAGPKENEKAAICKARGADIVVNYQDVVEATNEATGGKGVRVVYDGVGAATSELSLDCLGVRGMYVPYGNASGAVPPLNPLVLNTKGSLFMTRPKLNDYILDREEMQWRAGELFGWIAEGKLEVAIDTTFDLGEAAEAHEYIEGHNTTGKVLIKC